MFEVWFLRRKYLRTHSLALLATLYVMRLFFSQTFDKVDFFLINLIQIKILVIKHYTYFVPNYKCSKKLFIHLIILSNCVLNDKFLTIFKILSIEIRIINLIFLYSSSLLEYNSKNQLRVISKHMCFYI